MFGSHLGAAVAGIVYSLSMWHLRMGSPEGNLPMNLGYSLAPFFLYLLKLVSKGGSKVEYFVSVFGLALIVLVHHTTIISLVLPIALYGLYIFFNSLSDFRRILKIIGRGLFILFFAISLTVFWSIPFLLESKYMKVSSVRNPFYFNFWSVPPTSVITRIHGYVYYQGYLMLVAPLLALIMSIFSERRKEIFFMFILSCLLLVLSLGKYTPLGVLYLKVPFMEHMPPLRFLTSFCLFSSLLLGVFVIEVRSLLSRKISRKTIVFGYLIVFLIIVFHIWDIYPQSVYFKAEEQDFDYERVLLYLASKNRVFRVFQPSLLSLGSALSYAPALSGKEIFEGWYTEANLLQDELGWLIYLISNGKDLESAKKLVESYSLEYALHDFRHIKSNKIYDNLLKIGYAEEVRYGNVVVLKYFKELNYVTPLGVRGVIFGFYTSTIKKLFSGAITLEKGGEYVDSFSYEKLLKYNIVFLYGFLYKDYFKACELIRRYVENGGTLVIDTWGSPVVSSNKVLGLGFSSKIIKVFGRIKLKGLNNSLISPFIYEDSEWVSTVYDGLFDEKIVTYNGHTVIGVMRKGKGKIIVVGLNLFYHSIYYNNPYEKEFLVNILNAKEPSFQAVIEEYDDGYIRVKYNLSSPTVLRVSQAWYIHWHAILDGNTRLECEQDKATKLIVVSVPAGFHVLELVYKEPYTYLYYISLISVVAYVIIVLKFYRRLSFLYEED